MTDQRDGHAEPVLSAFREGRAMPEAENAGLAGGAREPLTEEEIGALLAKPLGSRTAFGTRWTSWGIRKANGSILPVEGDEEWARSLAAGLPLLRCQYVGIQIVSTWEEVPQW